jgi:uncharacterized protein YjlB
MKQTANIVKFSLQDNGVFPNSRLPALLYKGVLDIPLLFPATYVAHLFENNGWSNSWDAGIFEYHHYHSITHEVLGIYSGKTTIQLGGEKGEQVTVEKGDVLVIPAGVAHKNLGGENDVGVVGAYPGGKDYDMNYGEQGERPGTDNNIKAVPIPEKDPVFRSENELIKLWK